MSGLKKLWELALVLLLALPAHAISNNAGLRNVVYFGNWYAYPEEASVTNRHRAVKANFTPQDLPASSLTHVLYAFADPDPSSGQV